MIRFPRLPFTLADADTEIGPVSLVSIEEREVLALDWLAYDAKAGVSQATIFVSID